MASRSSKIRPWPGSTFRLKTEWHNLSDVRHFRVFLERRATGRYGRLEAMHAVVPKRKRLDGVDRFFASAKYRLNMLKAAGEVVAQAGVSKGQAESFMATIEKEYPAPTREELFLEEVQHPMVKLAMGERSKELSYYKTGVPELTLEDQRLLKDCMDEMSREVKTDRAFAGRFRELVLGAKGLF